ncbi:NF041680 family putative transposase [Dictyobacter formicarum]|uniref:Transposase IS701-like DDE domain-containing protein n=1 Tax=Dictyobacter formicarum TaxID=2778368 RepID=A0ABQ3VS55_9CHLR|nr:NF041680 family putative transposase [Dictyobacter formicarum]GHO88551.1 hypothetical protein KSZ_65570 [Dictyobacter formicarum]
MHFNTLKQFRQHAYGCFERGADSLFNTCDALLSEPHARSLVELSLSPCFERRWPSLYQALEHGQINEHVLRAMTLEAVLQELDDQEPLWIGVDASSIGRPEAETSADRGIIYVPNLPRVTKPVSAGWQFSTVMLLPEQPSSWVAILDQRRISTSQTAIEVAIAQLQELLPLITRPVVVLADRWYASAEFLRACQQLGCRVLIRLKRNRKLYRAPVRTHARGRMPLDGPVLQGSRPETLSGENASYQDHDRAGKLISVTRWDGLHVRQARDLSLSVVRLIREGAKDSKRDPRESWFVMLGPDIALSDISSVYARRFSQEHGYRFMKQDLLWAQAHVRTPEQFERWSLLVALAFNQLWLARSLGQACFRPWESHQRPITPRQVRRVMPTILQQLGTPTRVCQRRGKSPGRPPGFRPRPAPRYPVVLKSKPKATSKG